jgi:transposase
MLWNLARSRTAPVREAERAKILLAYAENRSITEVMRRVGVGRSTVYKCIDKALAEGVAAGLKDAYHRPHEPEIGEEAKAWVVSLACTKPKDHGRAAEVWSISALAEFVSSHAEEAGHPRLAQAGKSTVWRILNERQIKPHKISYYLERRDPDFDRKMQEVTRARPGHYGGARTELLGQAPRHPGTVQKCSASRSVMPRRISKLAGVSLRRTCSSRTKGSSPASSNAAAAGESCSRTVFRSAREWSAAGATANAATIPKNEKLPTATSAQRCWSRRSMVG